MSDTLATEIVVFKVSDPALGLQAARDILEDAKAFNNGILEAETYQSASDPHLIAQRITWKSLDAANEAAAAMESFPHMEGMMKVTTEQVLFEHFYER